MDICVNSNLVSWESTSPYAANQNVTFRDTAFVASLLKHYPKFNKATDKGMYAFDDDLLSACPVGVERIYIPFSINRQHWVGLCVNLHEWIINVIDCFSSFWRESKIKTCLNPLVEMLPYLIRLATTGIGKKKVSFQPLAIQRERDIPQACFMRHSGVMAVHLMGIHASGGSEACKLVNVTDVFPAAKKFLVDAYEHANGPA